MKQLFIILVCALSLLYSDLAFAQKTVHVKGYTKKDGTYVAPYERKAPTKSGTTESTPAAATPPPAAATPTPSTAVPLVSTPSSASTQPRDAKGRFVRSSSARRTFMRLTGYPTGRPGYVIDHIIPLACSGPDVPENMQWQTIVAAKEKDKVERVGCR